MAAKPLPDQALLLKLLRYEPESGSWRARIAKGGANYYLGTFRTFEEAVSARKDAERRLGFHANHGRSR